LHFARGDFDGMNRVLGSGLTLTAALAGLALLFIAILEVFAGKALGVEGHLLSSARWVVLIIGAGYVFDQLVGVFEAPLFVTQKLYVLEIAQVLSRVLAVLGVVLLFGVTTPTIVGWVALTVACTVVLKLLYTIPASLRALPQLRLRFHMPSGPEFKEMAGFSAASLLGSLGSAGMLTAQQTPPRRFVIDSHHHWRSAPDYIPTLVKKLADEAKVL